LGAASSSQAIAPRNGGVTKEAVTSPRTAFDRGKSVRATSHPMGAATRQQTTEAVVAIVIVMNNGPAKLGSVNRRATEPKNRPKASSEKPSSQVWVKTSPTKAGSENSVRKWSNVNAPDLSRKLYWNRYQTGRRMRTHSSTTKKSSTGQDMSILNGRRGAAAFAGNAMLTRGLLFGPHPEERPQGVSRRMAACSAWPWFEAAVRAASP
jgi:hypothetical protein